MTKMNKTTTLFLAALLMTGCADKQEQSFTLKGNIGNWNDPATLYLSYWNEGSEYLDTIRLQDGKFAFTGAISEPAPARLILDYAGEGMGKRTGGTYPLSLSGERYSETGTPDSLHNSQFINSPINDEYWHILTIGVADSGSGCSDEPKGDACNARTVERHRLYGAVELGIPANAGGACAETAAVCRTPDSYFSIVAYLVGFIRF